MRSRVTVLTMVGALVVLLLGPVAPASASHAYDRDFDGDGRPDVVAPAETGHLRLYPTTGSGGWETMREYGPGWNLMDEVHLAGDWDGDGHPDVIARSIRTGDLSLYRGDGAGGFLGVTRIGTGWHSFSDIVVPGDWNGDDAVDVLGVRRDDGTLWLYAGDGRGGWGEITEISGGWQHRDLITAVGDWDGDDFVDLLARDPRNGDLWLYSGNGAGDFQDYGVIGTRWNAMTALVGLGDFNGDGDNDVLARTGNGDLVLYRGNGAGGWVRPYPQVGSGWNSVRLSDETQTPSRVVTYSVRGLGDVQSDVGHFARHVDWTLDDYRGWSLGWDIRFDQVDSGGDFTLYLASPAVVEAAAPVCSANWSCRVGDRVYVNDMRWREATDTYRPRPLVDYRHYVVNHEVGHWFELGHWSCGGSGRPAPVMQQQSISLGACTSNVWPLQAELDAARDFAF